MGYCSTRDRSAKFTTKRTRLRSSEFGLVIWGGLTTARFHIHRTYSRGLDLQVCTVWLEWTNYSVSPYWQHVKLDVISSTLLAVCPRSKRSELDRSTAGLCCICMIPSLYTVVVLLATLVPPGRTRGVSTGGPFCPDSSWWEGTWSQFSGENRLRKRCDQKRRYSNSPFSA